MDIRRAQISDLSAIIRLLADDELGETRECLEEPLPQAYLDAFTAIELQSGNAILVAVENNEVIGCLQLTYIPGLARLGMTRAQIEGVRVDRHHRSDGIGSALFEYAIQAAREHGCGLVQLTTDRSRIDAHRFYDRLGFVASHEGMKLHL